MRYEDLNSSQRSTFRLGLKCDLCNRKLTRVDDFQILKMRYGRSILHFYFHSNCLLAARGLSQLGGVKNEEEEIKEAII